MIHRVEKKCKPLFSHLLSDHFTLYLIAMARVQVTVFGLSGGGYINPLITRCGTLPYFQFCHCNCSLLSYFSGILKYGKELIPINHKSGNHPFTVD